MRIIIIIIVIKKTDEFSYLHKSFNGEEKKYNVCFGIKKRNVEEDHSHSVFN